MRVRIPTDSSNPAFGSSSHGRPAQAYPGLSRPSNVVALTSAGERDRVVVEGKHLALNGIPFRVRGVTYGGFRPRSDGAEFPDTARVRRDFQAIATSGLNVVRTYTLPPADMLDAAEDWGLRLIVGLHYDDWRVAGDTSRRSRRGVLDAGRAAVERAAERCSDRRSILAIAVGNEVPGDLVRLYGIRSVEEILSVLVDDVHEAGFLATYCNYPTTEYLDVAGQDFISFNVFLEDDASLRAYLRHLQVVSADSPLVITELGLAADVHGEATQATLLERQLRLVDESGCAGATVFAWTDDWFVAGLPVDGWGFGVTDAERKPKPSLDVVSAWARSGVRDLRSRWPRVSAIVCAYNEERHIPGCLRSLERCDYPNLEVIVCDDGSTDRTLEIVRRFPFDVIDLPHAGLSVARNAGLAAATGEIVAYIDADATAHQEWPYHIALAFEDEAVAAAGGPNLPVPGAGFVERAVAHSPGGPIHVLLSDDRAEHVPGCNMAFRSAALREVGGFDPIFTAAGDDVDVCWKILDAGHQIAYAPGAQVLHHRRDRIRGYLRQQRSYGKAERMVSGRHPHRYGRLGRARWSGSIYGGARMLPAILKPVIYHGRLGLAPFQSVVRHRSASVLAWGGALLPVAFPVMLLGALAVLSPWWLVPAGVATGLVGGYAAAIGFAVRPAHDEPHPSLFRVFVALLHVVQPAARTWGRLRGRPARLPATSATPPGDRAGWIEELRRDLAWRGCRMRLGGDNDRWDLEARSGPFLACRITTGIGWGSAPRWRTTFRPRWPLVFAVALIAAVGAAGARAAAPLTLLLAAGVLFEARVARRRLRASVEPSGVPRPAGIPPVVAAPRPRAERPPRAEPRTNSATRGDRRLARRILAEGRPSAGRLVALFLLGLLETPLLLLAPIPLKIAVDSVIGTRPLPGFLDALLPGGLTNSTTRILLAAAALQVIVIVLINVQQVAEDLLGAHIGEGLTLRLRARLFAQLQRLSLSFHDARGTADSMYRIQYDASATQDYLVKGVLPLVASAVSLVSMIYVTARIDWQLALVGLGVSPFLFFLARSYKTSLRARHRHTKELESSALNVVQEVLTGLRVVKAFVREDVEQDRFVDRSSEGMRARVRLVLAQGLLATLVSLVTALGTAAVLFIGVRNVQSGSLSVGELLVVLAYLSQLYGPLRTISKNTVQLQSALAGAERAFDLLDRYPDVIDPPGARRIQRAAGSLELRGVSFSYGREEPVLRNVTLSVPPGTRLGIVGPTGAGKTTLSSLLMRFFEPSEGTILLDGVDVREYAVADLRRQFALVLQESLLFSTSVRENIAYGRLGARDDEIVEAAKLAGAHGFIERLPQGYDTLVGERGMLLSGGERQRISLARAFLKDAPLLILDEPTSSLDAATEERIIEAMNRLMQGRTTLVISHRPSALRNCTAIVRIEDGRLVTVADGGAIPGEASRPLLEERRASFVRASSVDPDHEAVRAWRLVSPGAPLPTTIERLTRAQKARSDVYRLRGAGPGGEPLVAKREGPQVVRLERLLYEDVLPSLALGSLRCFGAIEGEEASWIFLEDAGGEPFSESDPAHRVVAARWMGAMHVASSERPDLAAMLPSHGPRRYADHLRRGRKTIVENLANPELKGDDVAILKVVLRHFDELEEGWRELSEFCDAVPSCLVHGDFVSKNAQVRFRGKEPSFVLMDWQTAGWGAPASDVMRLDTVAYGSAVEARWPHLDKSDIDELARIGTIFRALAAIDWEARMLAYPWVDGALRNIRGYEGWLTLARRGVVYRMGSAGL